MQRKQALFDIINKLGRVVVALSGGTDSSYLLSACVDVLGVESVRAVTVRSPLFPAEEDAVARQIADWAGVEHTILEMDDLANPLVAANPRDRCYHCKRARFSALMHIAAKADSVVVHGENLDDLHVYRPGSRAAAELGTRAPLAEAKLTKADIRALAQERGVPNYARPSAACLATRFPYDTPLTQEGLERVEAAENTVRELLGDVQLRVRDHYPIARIELDPQNMIQAVQPDLRFELVARLTALGYRYVTLDLQGFKSGSFDDTTANNPS